MSLQASGASAALRSAALRSSSSSGRRSAGGGLANKGKPWAEYVPVYGALGAIALSVTLGLGTARHELANAPNVRLDKRKRETVPEVAAPDLAVDEADRFLRGSLFRRVARIAQDDHRDPAAATAEKKAVTLKDAGVEPPGIQRSREEVLAAMNIFKRDSANKMNA
ncbi:unnamed protein product [Urochloa decumbens]|uniref:Uncharacterized protein n=1 Tax=Urochloa decumbens TaxID=240449 RepID=A0ABC9D9W3_9POAL